MNTYLKIALYFIGALLVLFILQGIYIGLLMFSFVFKMLVTSAIIVGAIMLYKKFK
jgi:hypothetical protein